MECVNCKTNNRENAIFYRGFGGKTVFKCSHCMNSFPPDLKFCGSCGTSIIPMGDAHSEIEAKEAAMVEWFRQIRHKGGAENLFELCADKFSAILIKEALKMNGGNRSQAASLLGLWRPSLHPKLGKLSIE